MKTINEYLEAISNRGDEYGGSGGILDLLYWCGKSNTQEVTLEEAERYYHDPNQPYKDN